MIPYPATWVNHIEEDFLDAVFGYDNRLYFFWRGDGWRLYRLRKHESTPHNAREVYALAYPPRDVFIFDFAPWEVKSKERFIGWLRDQDTERNDKYRDGLDTYLREFEQKEDKKKTDKTLSDTFDIGVEDRKWMCDVPVVPVECPWKKEKKGRKKKNGRLAKLNR